MIVHGVVAIPPVILTILVWLALHGVAHATVGNTPERDASSIAGIDLRLTIYRAGERLPDGRSVGLRGSVVRGVATYRLPRPSASGESLILLDFARHLDEEPRHLDALAKGTYLDGPFGAVALQVDQSRGVRKLHRRGDRGDWVVELEAGQREFTLVYEVRVPHRYWPFGCIERRCSLSGALAPLPSAKAHGGRWLPPGGRVVAPVKWRVDARFASAPTWVPGRVPRPVEARVLAGDDLEVVQPSATVPYPSVFWGPAWRRLEHFHHGVHITVLHSARRPLDHYPDETPIQLRRDVPGRLQAIAVEVVELMEMVGRPLAPGTNITVLHGPLRSQLAQSHPGLVMVSDHAFQIFPARRFLRFHELAVVRALLDELWSRVFRKTHDPSVDQWLAGTVAFSLVGAWEQMRDNPDEYAWDILRNFTFMPAIDRFLYTGQASFSGAYFRGSEDHMPLRNHPLWFSHGLPTGRRIHEKLLDTLGARRLGRAYETLIRDPAANPIGVFERAYGRRLNWFFDQWLGPYPEVDYSVRDVDSVRSAGGWIHTIAVEKSGRRPSIEPVQVLVEEDNGRIHHLVWNGEIGQSNTDLTDEPLQGTHTWRLETTSPLSVVSIDPRSRLVETPQPPRENVDPLFNNRNPPAGRFLYTGAGLNIGASEFVSAATAPARLAAIDAYAFFEGSLRRDLRRTGHLQLYHDRETWGGISGGVNFWLGAKINRQRRRTRISVFQTVDWLNGLGLDRRGGLRLEQSVSLIDETRSFFMWPNRGRRLWLGVTPRQTLRLDGGGDHRYDILASAGWVQLWPIAHDHVLASTLAAAMVFPLRGRPEFRNLLRVGGIGGLSAYVGDEVFGLASANAQLEYRHQYFTNLHINLAHLAWVRQIGGVLFGGVSTVSRCESYRGWFGPQSWYGEVGYGVTAHTEILGVSPQFFRLDVAVPLVRRRSRCLDELLPDYLAEVQGVDDVTRLLPPVTVNITFVQPF